MSTKFWKQPVLNFLFLWFTISGEDYFRIPGFLKKLGKKFLKEGVERGVEEIVNAGAEELG